MRRSLRGRLVTIASLVGFIFGTMIALPVSAQTAESNNYQATDLEFGTTTGEGCSTQYCAETNLGQVVIGDSGNDVMNAQFYDSPNDEPQLEVIVANSSSNMGVLKTDKIASKSMALRIRSTNTAGYSVQLEGDPPKAGGHTLKTSQKPNFAKPGEEGFGINVVSNTTPEVGRNPELSDTKADQTNTIAEPYRQADKFLYKPGDTIIKNQLTNSRVDYVVSMVVTISSDTPPGYYVSTLHAVVTPLL